MQPSTVPQPRAGEHAEAGFFGKLPSKGDFLSRRLPPGFVEVWDAWLQAGISSSRGELGDAWAGYFLEAPVWRFFMPPRMVTERAWIGILLPSVDRVGRYYPLTIAAGIAQDCPDGAETLGMADSWLAAIETAALDALKPGANADAFDARLAALPFPLSAVVRTDRVGGSPPPAIAERRFLAFPLESDERPLVEQLRWQLEGVAQNYALWWTAGSDASPGCVLASDSLPAGGRFCALLNRRWEQHGWSAGCDLKGNGV